MNTLPEEALTIDEHSVLSYTELVTVSGVPEDLVRELVRYGALAPLDPDAPAWSFEGHSLLVVRTAQRLRHDFDLDAHAVTVLLGYVERIQALEAQLRALRAQLG